MTPAHLRLRTTPAHEPAHLFLELAEHIKQRTETVTARPKDPHRQDFALDLDDDLCRCQLLATLPLTPHASTADADSAVAIARSVE